MLEALKMLEMFTHVSSQDQVNDVTSQCLVRQPDSITHPASTLLIRPCNTASPEKTGTALDFYFLNLIEAVL